jgi:hypothetical protein
MNHHEEHKKGSRDEILARIRRDGIAMKPRLFFTAHIVATALTAVAVLAVSIFIFNFILFSIRINSHDAFLSFGPRGIEMFFRFFPWIFLFADIGLIVLLETLVRKFRFGYRLPIVYLVGGILVLTVFFALILDRGTSFNDRLMDRAGDHRLPPPLNDLYSGARREPHDGICRCTVTAIEGVTLTVEDYRAGATTTFLVVLPENDPRATTTHISIGDVVMVAGDREGNTIRAFGVRKADVRPNGAPLQNRGFAPQMK